MGSFCVFANDCGVDERERIPGLMKQQLAPLLLGISRRWRSGLMAGMTALGLVWLLTEVAVFISESTRVYLQSQPWWYSAAAASLAILAFVISVYEPRSIRIRIPTTDTHLNIKYGDLFDETGHLLIAVNEFFDGSLGQRVSPMSVHGQAIVKFFNSDEYAFRAAVDHQLVPANGLQTGRVPAPDVAYPAGTTAVVNIGGRSVFLFVLSRTDLITAKACTDVPAFWQAVCGALEAAHHYGNGEAISLPLIGNGLSGLNLPPQHLLRMLTLCLVYFARAKYLPKDVTLVLPEACFEYLDLREIQRDWI